MDLVALLPLDYIVVYTATRHSGGMSDEALNYFQLFRLLRMVGRRPDMDMSYSHFHLHFFDLTSQHCWWRLVIVMLTHAVAAMQLRMYRVPQFFLELEYKLNVSLLGVTLVRNFVFL